VIIDNHETACMLHTQMNIRRAAVFACVYAIANHTVCFHGAELTETVVPRIFHADTSERMMSGRARIMYEQMR